MSCEQCYNFWTKRNQETPCGPCPKPILASANYTAWEVFLSLTSQLKTAGMGGVLGVDYSSLPAVFEAYGVPEEHFRFEFEKIAIINSIACKYWNQDSGSDSGKK